MAKVNPNRDWIALTLAVGICTALNVLVIEVALAAATRGDYALSENATQILTGWGGGIIGILGAVFGYRAGTATHDGGTSAPPADPDAPTPYAEGE